MPRHVYFEAADLRPPRRRVQLVTAWIALLAMFVATYELARLAPALAPVVFGALVAFLAVVVVFAIVKQSRTTFVPDLQDVELARLREHTGDAIAKARTLLKKPLHGHQQALVLMSLGCCAEDEGDFAEAAGLFVRAESSLRVAAMPAMSRAQYLALVAARRAFAHAALGDLQRARATLGTTRLRDAFPSAMTYARRAELVISAREGALDRLATELAASETLIRNTAAWRDRALVNTLEKMTSRDSAKQLEVEPRLRDWIVAVLGPSAEPHVRGVS
jgi:hypothetical protein